MIQHLIIANTYIINCWLIWRVSLPNALLLEITTGSIYFGWSVIFMLKVIAIMRKYLSCSWWFDSTVAQWWGGQLDLNNWEVMSFSDWKSNKLLIKSLKFAFWIAAACEVPGKSSTMTGLAGVRMMCLSRLLY